MTGDDKSFLRNEAVDIVLDQQLLLHGETWEMSALDSKIVTAQLQIVQCCIDYIEVLGELVIGIYHLHVYQYMFPQLKFLQVLWQSLWLIAMLFRCPSCW